MKKIIDEFTNLPLSRARKRQLRYIRDGRCGCGGVRPKNRATCDGCIARISRCAKMKIKNAVFKEKTMKCKFDCAWRGPCGNPSGDDMICADHAHLRCASCGKQATRECEHTGIQFVCGYLLCDGCEHAAPEVGKEGMFMLGGGHKPKAEAEESWKKRYEP